MPMPYFVEKAQNIETCCLQLEQNEKSGYLANKALVVELLCVFAAILKRNPELDFTGELSCDALIQEAVAVFKKVH